MYTVENGDLGNTGSSYGMSNLILGLCTVLQRANLTLECMNREIKNKRRATTFTLYKTLESPISGLCTQFYCSHFKVDVETELPK